MTRLLLDGRAVLGALLLTAPDAVLRPVARRRVEPGERAVARLLGLRNLVEAGILARHRGRRFLLVDAAVDATHSLSMVALAVGRPRHRRLAVASALVATSTAVASLVSAGSRRA